MIKVLLFNADNQMGYSVIVVKKVQMNFSAKMNGDRAIILICSDISTELLIIGLKKVGLA